MIPDSAGVTDPGPRSSNEDCYALWNVGATFYAAVADGLGGMGGGAHASRYAIRFLKERAIERPLNSDSLAELVMQAHRGLVQEQSERPQFRSMATTLTVVAIHASSLVGAHCGDTRLYLARGNGIKRLSEDHSEGARLFKEGLISRKELSDYPRNNILESAIGVKGEPTIQGIEYNLQLGDWLILASDGAYAKLATAELRDFCKSSKSAAQLVFECDMLIRQRGPSDNYTLVAARMSGA